MFSEHTFSKHPKANVSTPLPAAYETPPVLLLFSSIIRPSFLLFFFYWFSNKELNQKNRISQVNNCYKALKIVSVCRLCRFYLNGIAGDGRRTGHSKSQPLQRNKLVLREKITNTVSEAGSLKGLALPRGHIDIKLVLLFFSPEMGFFCFVSAVQIDRIWQIFSNNVSVMLNCVFVHCSHTILYTYGCQMSVRCHSTLFVTKIQGDKLL